MYTVQPWEIHRVKELTDDNGLLQYAHARIACESIFRLMQLQSSGYAGEADIRKALYHTATIMLAHVDAGAVPSEMLTDEITVSFNAQRMPVKRTWDDCVRLARGIVRCV